MYKVCCQINRLHFLTLYRITSLLARYMADPNIPMRLRHAAVRSHTRLDVAHHGWTPAVDHLLESKLEWPLLLVAWRELALLAQANVELDNLFISCFKHKFASCPDVRLRHLMFVALRRALGQPPTIVSRDGEVKLSQGMEIDSVAGAALSLPGGAMKLKLRVGLTGTGKDAADAMEESAVTKARDEDAGVSGHFEESMQPGEAVEAVEQVEEVGLPLHPLEKSSSLVETGVDVGAPVGASQPGADVPVAVESGKKIKLGFKLKSPMA